jgi:transmembrane protein TMEM260 (protein O-mannosyltransferase)
VSRDAILASAAGTVALALYVRTLAPGLTADVDSAVFQLVGLVLGIPHNPGYPLYVLVTHAFSYVPVGALAYRINLFSALLGGVTVGLTFLLARELRCDKAVSFAAALGLATGHVFWSQAVIAEVYTLHAALVAGLLLAMLAWGHSGRAGYYFTAVGLLAAGLGNHLTIVGFAPGMAAYALLVNRAFALRARTLLASALLLLTGLLPYALIVIRSATPGAYVESPATTLRGLVDVMVARQFQDRLFAFDAQAVMLERVPHVARTLAAELSAPALIVAAGAAIWLLRRRRAEAILLFSGCAAVLIFAVNYRVVDTPVFLIPAILVCWLAAAVGVEQVKRGADRRLGVAARVVISVSALVLPIWHLTRNLPITDRSRDTRAAVQLERLFAALPDHTAIVREDFVVDRMLMFKLLGERAAGDRRIDVTSRDARRVWAAHHRGERVFAFAKSARLLRLEGLAFGFAPVRLLEGALHDHLSRLPDGAVVAIAVPGHHVAAFAASRGVQLDAIGGPPAIAVPPSSSLVVVGVRGARRGARVEAALPEARVPIAAGEPIGETRTKATAPFEAWSEAAEAGVRLGGRDVVRTSEGAALVTWDPSGNLVTVRVLQMHEQFQVPVPHSHLSVFALRGEYPRREISGGDWSEVGDLARSGSMLVQVPAGQGAVFYVADDRELAPRPYDRSSARAHVDVVSFGEDEAGLRDRLRADGAAGTGLERQRAVYRIQIDAPSNAAVSVHLALGGVPVRAIGRATRAAASGLPVLFGVALDGLLRTPDRTSEVLLMGRDDQAQLTGAGWSDAERHPAGPFRWMTSPEADLVLPIAMSEPRALRIQAVATGDTRESSLQLAFDGHELSAQALRDGWHAYDWALPAALAVPRIVEVTVRHVTPAGEAGRARTRVGIGEVRVLRTP